MNRSSCASGSGYVPSCSIGFCVASTKNGSGSRCVVPAGRDRVLLHRLQQRGLRLRRGAVDLVGEHDVGEDRPAARTGTRGARSRASSSSTSVPVMSLGIRSGVNCTRANSRSSACGDGLHEQRLREPGHADEQDVPAGEQRGDQVVDDLVLPDDAAGDLRGEGGAGGGELGEQRRRRREECGSVTAVQVRDRPSLTSARTSSGCRARRSSTRRTTALSVRCRRSRPRAHPTTRRRRHAVALDRVVRAPEHGDDRVASRARRPPTDS